MFTSDTNFLRSVRGVLEDEGVFSDDPNDSGGLTKYGISQAAYPNIDIRTLTKETAVIFYHRDYWMPLRCWTYFGPVAMGVFDAAVNQGQGDAPKFLQMALGVKPDGIIGPQTLQAAKRIGRAEFLKFLERFNERRILDYFRAASFPHHGRGWMNRLNRVTIRQVAWWAEGTE